MDICREAPAVCSTFYLYYDSVDMLKGDIENAEMYEIVRHTDAVVDVPLEVDMMSFLRDTIAYIRTKQALYYAFLVHEPNADFIAKWKNAIKEHIRKRLSVLGLRPKNIELRLEILAAEAIGIYAFVLTHPHEIDEDNIAQIAVHALRLMEGGKAKENMERRKWCSVFCYSSRSFSWSLTWSVLRPTTHIYFFFFPCFLSSASLRHACKRIWLMRMSVFVGAMAAPSVRAFHAPA